LARAFNALTSSFLWTAVAAILRDLLRHLLRASDADGGGVLGAICNYLIAADA